MAKTPASTLISDLCKRVDMNPGTTGDGSAERLDALRMLNASQSTVLQDHSLRFLVDEGTLTLLSAGSSVAVPTTIDDGKLISLGRPGGDGEIVYVPPDEWFRTNLDTYRQPATGNSATHPSYYTISRVAGVNTFLFKPSNTSGGNLSIPYKAQAVPVAMTDSASSFSVLPEGWEDSLLIDHAEIEWRRVIGMDMPNGLAERTSNKQERLYSSYRTTKEQPMTDREQSERKVAREKLAPEKP